MRLLDIRPGRASRFQQRGVETANAAVKEPDAALFVIFCLFEDA
jgi:hypothetical protein